ncbi:MAG: helix-turn-helix transcriptional regulator [Opitutales bacterium]
MKNEIGVLLKRLILKNGMNQRSFSEKIDLSATALSQIITGKTKPRQATLTKIMTVLTLTDDEEQDLLKAFENSNSLPEDTSSPVEPLRVYKENRERCYRYLEMKSRSIAFNNEVELILQSMGVEYIKDYMKSNIVCDYYIKDLNIGIECKFNVTRDVEKTLTISKIVKENLKFDELCLVVPMKNEIPQDVITAFASLDIEVLSLVELMTKLR